MLSSTAESNTVISFSISDATLAAFVGNPSCTVPAGQNACSVTIAGESTGLISVYASAGGYAAATPASINIVNTGVISFNPSTVTITTGGGAVPVVIQLSAPAPVGGVLVSIATADSSIVTTSATTCTIPVGQNSCTVSVNGISQGTASVWATAAGYAGGSNIINVVAIGTVSFLGTPPTLHVGGNTTNLTAQLSSPATQSTPIYFSTSDATIAVITGPQYCTVPVGQTACSVLISGISQGVVDLYASAAGYTSTSGTPIQVINSGVLAFSPSALSIPVESSGIESTAVVVQLSGAAPVGGVVVSVTTGNSSVATVAPVTCTVPQNQSGCSVNVSGVSQGTTTLYATATGYESATNALSVVANGLISFIAPSITLGYPGSTTVYVQLSNPAPVGGVLVNFVSNIPNLIGNPGSCTVPVGQYNCSTTVTSAATVVSPVSIYPISGGYSGTPLTVTQP